MKLANQDILNNLIANYEQQLHQSKWTFNEDVILLEAIAHNWSVQKIKSQAIKLRTKSAIYTRANYLGFGYKTNKENGQVYFLEDINHKNRRTKKEILAELGKVPIHSAKYVEDHDKKSTIIIPEKIIDLSVSDIEKAIQILIKTKEEKMKNDESSLDVKIDVINELETSDIEKVANDNQSIPFTRLVKLFEDSAMTENEILDLVGIIFVLETLILSENMRDKRLTELSQNQVENLAMELYLSVENKRSSGDGYGEMCEVANQVISKHLYSKVESNNNVG